MSAIATAQPSLRATVLEWLPVLAGLLVLYAPVFYQLANTLWQDDDYAHGPIILAIILWLIWDKRTALLAPANNSTPKLGIPLLAFGLILYLAGSVAGIRILEVGALLPILAGTLLAMRGWSAIRAMWFMLIFIAYLLPLPGIFVDAVTSPLKQNVSAAAEQLLYLANYPIARSGVMLTIGQYQMLVADACSGLNSMFSLSAVGLLYLYLVQRNSWLHNCLIIGALLPIAFFANILRVITLILITYHYGDAAGQGFLHGFSGLALFLIALIFIILIDAILVRAIPKGKA
ncbi:MAG: exosortase B [Steroidobacteraceae bacterium]